MNARPGLDPDHAPALLADLGVDPSPLTVAPRTAEAVAGVLREAQGPGVVPVGGGTALGFGAPPAPVDQLLSLRRMDRILDHSVADFVITVEAGIGWSALQSKLAEHGQWVPVEPPDADRATLGGMIAAAAPSLLAASQGTLRDALLGVRLAWPDGRVTKAGGRVVKNVSGYDLMKLVHGSHGTLAVVVEASLRLRALPARDLVWSAPVDSLNRALELARTTQAALRAEPASLHLLAPAGAAGPLQLVARLQGAPQAVDQEGGRLDSAWRAASLEGTAHEVTAAGPRPPALCALDQVLSRGEDADVVQYAVHFRRSRLDPIVECHQQCSDALATALPFAVDLLGGRLQARHAADPPGRRDAPRWSAVLSELRAQLAVHGASLVRLAAPSPIRARVPSVDPAPGVARLEQRIRQQFDPRRVLSPGRLEWTGS